jgi:hypothetical protein
MIIAIANALVENVEVGCWVIFLTVGGAFSTEV